jgi:hypothetical protein
MDRYTAALSDRAALSVRLVGSKAARDPALARRDAQREADPLRRFSREKVPCAY